MKKITIILDSYSGKSKKEINERGWSHVYQSIIIDGTNYADGIDIFLEKDRMKINNAKDIKTSMPPLGLVVETFEKLSKDYEHVVFLPMNKEISGTYSAAAAAAKDFKNVTVVANLFSGSAMIEAAEYIEREVNANKNLNQVLINIEKFSNQAFTSVIPRSIDGLIRSGRVTGLKKIILEKAKLIPILFVGKKGFEVKGLKRSFDKAVTASLDDALNFINHKIDKFNFEIIYCGDTSSLEAAKAALEKANIKDYKTSYANCPIAGHAGIGAIGFNVYPKML